MVDRPRASLMKEIQTSIIESRQIYVLSCFRHNRRFSELLRLRWKQKRTDWENDFVINFAALPCCDYFDWLESFVGVVNESSWSKANLVFRLFFAAPKIGQTAIFT